MNAYQRAVKEITDTRRDDLDDGLYVWSSALESDPELRAAYAYYQSEAIKKAQKQDNSLDGARRDLYEKARACGITKDAVIPPCRCGTCNDTGYVGGRYCRCVINKVINSDKENLTLPLVGFNEKRNSAPKAVAKYYSEAQNYIDEFPSGKPFFIAAGSSGTGKTVLAAATASEFMTRGLSVVTVTAFDFVKRAKEYHTQFAVDDYRDLFSPMLDCDLLVIDDLGTEIMLKNITREYFYTVINERWLRRKYTFITTNLSPNALLERYGEAVFSRLCDRSAARLYNMSAENVRLKNK